MMNCNGLFLVLQNDFFPCTEFEMRVGSRKGKECGSLKGGITSKRMLVVCNYLGWLTLSNRYYRGIPFNQTWCQS